MPTSAPTADLAPATISEYDGVRYLHLGTPWVQGAMRIRKPLALELEYIQRMMAWMLLRPTAELTDGHAVQLGLGAAAITRFVHTSLRMRCTAVELNPSVIDACRLWFHLPPESPRFELLRMDAARYVADPARVQSVQVLCVDLYDHDAASPVLDSAAFYRACHRVLADGGVMSVNLFGRDASFERSLQRIAEAFGAERVASLRPTKEGNTVVLAIKAVATGDESRRSSRGKSDDDDVRGDLGDASRDDSRDRSEPAPSVAWPDRATLATRADTIEARFKLPARKWLRMIRPAPATSA